MKLLKICLLLIAVSIFISFNNAYATILYNSSQSVSLENRTIAGDGGPGIAIVNNSNVTLNIIGSVNITGSFGYAGIYVESGSTVNITGSGTLTVTGGSSSKDRIESGTNIWQQDNVPAVFFLGAGAGIGGNGAVIIKPNNNPTILYEPSFGTINIDGPTVVSNGGKSDNFIVGAAAGIGSGSANSHLQGLYYVSHSGVININSGNVKATGGVHSSVAGGGAGIGTGSENGANNKSNVKININGGNVEARGSSGGAGIGSGANVCSGLINISGGNVKAYGSQYGSSSASGAAIGGGDNGFYDNIKITGDSVVYAEGKGKAAGIGSGNNAINEYLHDKANGYWALRRSTIEISRNADVTAYGGDMSDLGAPAIGASEYGENRAPNFGTIKILNNAVVKAYGGKNSNCIGLGYHTNELVEGTDSNISSIEYVNSLIIDETAEVFMFSHDSQNVPFIGINEDNKNTLDDHYVKKSTIVVWNFGNGSSGTLFDNNTKSDSNYTYSIVNNKLIISYNGKSIIETTCDFLNGSYTIKNFAVASSKIKNASSSSTTGMKYIISFNTKGGTKIADMYVSKNEIIDLSSIKEPLKDGFTFAGWYDDETFSNRVTSIEVNKNINLFAKWEEKQSPYQIADIPSDLEGELHNWYLMGYEDGLVRPTNNITRAETVTIFYRLLKEDIRKKYYKDINDFEDVQAEDWYNVYVSSMENYGIIKGRGQNIFAPNDYITRAEFATICSRFDTKNSYTKSIAFSDISDHWAKDYIIKASQYGWIAGYEDGSFKPDNYITRAEVATIVNRMLHRFPESKKSLLPNMIIFPDNKESAWYYLAIQEAANSHDYVKDNYGEEWSTLNN
jgi:uncharacterized repeat protein (TIGR02543 family)